MWNLLRKSILLAICGWAAACTPTLDRETATKLLSDIQLDDAGERKADVLTNVWIPRPGVAQIQLMGWSGSRPGGLDLTAQDQKLPGMKCYRALEKLGVVSGGKAVAIPDGRPGAWLPRFEFSFDEPLVGVGGPKNGSLCKLRTVYARCDGVRVTGIAVPENEKGVALVEYHVPCVSDRSALAALEACGKETQVTTPTRSARFVLFDDGWRLR